MNCDVQVMRQYEQSPVSYDAEALEFQHAREIKQRQKVKRRSSLKTYKASRLFAFRNLVSCFRIFREISVSTLCHQCVDAVGLSVRRASAGIRGVCLE